MKTSLFLLLLIANINIVFSQIVAGSPSSGLIISNPSVNFSVATVMASSTRSIDLNCDGTADMSFELYKGPTAIDGANMASVHVLNQVFQVCADTVNYPPRKVHYFNAGDTVMISANTNWYNDPNIELGLCGCMDCVGPCLVNNLFIGYRNNNTSQIGWIKLSFNLNDGGSSSPISLSSPEVLSPCVNTAITSYTGTGGNATCGIFNFDYTIYSPHCNGMCDGSITISNFTGGTPNYTFTWSNGQTGGVTLSNLCSGVYMLNVSDASGNTCNTSFNVPSPTPVSFSLTTTAVSCFGGNDGGICSYSLSGGTAPYSFECFPAGGTTSCANHLPAGAYYFCVTDANNCQVCHTVVVNESPPLHVNEVLTQASCASCCDANLQLQISGGSGAYTITFTPATPSCPGSYSYCVTDSKNCIYCDSVLVSYPTLMNEYDIKSSITISPNPNNGSFEIQNLRSENTTVKIILTDVNGKSFLTKTVQIKNKQLPININVEDGVYILHIIDTSNSKEVTRKIIVQNKN